MFSPAVRGNSALWKERRALLFRLSGKPRLPYHGRPGKSGLPGHDEDAARRRKGFLPPRFMEKAAPSLTPCKKFPHLPVSSPRMWGGLTVSFFENGQAVFPTPWGCFRHGSGAGRSHPVFPTHVGHVPPAVVMFFPCPAGEAVPQGPAALSGLFAGRFHHRDARAEKAGNAFRGAGTWGQE